MGFIVCLAYLVCVYLKVQVTPKIIIHKQIIICEKPFNRPIGFVISSILECTFTKTHNGPGKKAFFGLCWKKHDKKQDQVG